MRTTYTSLAFVATIFVPLLTLAGSLDDVYSQLFDLRQSVDGALGEGDYAQAETHARTALSLVRRVDDAPPELIVEHLINVAVAARLGRKGKEAEGLLLEAQRTLRALASDEPVQYAVLLLNLGWAQVLQEQDQSAEQHFVDALGILEKELGLGNLYAAEAELGQMVVRLRADQLAEAEALFDHAWPLVEEIVGPESSLALWYRSELGRINLEFETRSPSPTAQAFTIVPGATPGDLVRLIGVQPRE
jgi:tetratricopeptide (TPR) repeat protein